MNGYQRIKAALKGEKTDTTPIMLHNFMMAVKEAGCSMEQYRNDPRIIADVYIKAIETYGYDGVVVDLDTVTLAGACGVDVDFPVNEPARSHLGILDSISDAVDLKPVNIENYKYVQIWCESVRLVKEHFKDEIFVRGNCDQDPFSLATMLRGPANFMMDLCIESEEATGVLLEYCCDVTSQFIRLMKQTGADMASNGDSPAGPSMLSPDMYEKFALPYEKRIADVARQEGIDYLLHICGNTDVILERMVTCGANALELDYMTDIVLAEKLMRGKVTFVGNIDPSGVIALGTPELVVQKTVELLDVFKDNPRFILNAGCGIPSITPAENLRAMIKCAREYRG